jgi:hypothetical protein
MRKFFGEVVDVVDQYVFGVFPCYGLFDLRYDSRRYEFTRFILLFYLWHCVGAK